MVESEARRAYEYRMQNADTKDMNDSMDNAPDDNDQERDALYDDLVDSQDETGDRIDAETGEIIPPYILGLNPPQREAVQTIDGPLLVLAGAGTGKTRVLTTRLAHILCEAKAWPQQILTVTFTNKAAQEMKERVRTLLGEMAADGRPPAVDGWWLGTFHALGARMLRKHADLVGLASNFTIIDADDQVRLIKQLMIDAELDTKKWAPKVMAGKISEWKDKVRLPRDLKPSDGGEMANGKLVMIYRQYQDRLKVLNACDFGDLLLHVITILRDPANAHILQDYQNQFKYILVDEYQDTNVAQYMWLRLLAGAQGYNKGYNKETENKPVNICCVGDDDQSIYGWRGAEVGNILRFEQDFPGAKIIRLEQNYRSTGHILSAASSVISNNQDRMGKTLWSDQEQGEKVSVRGLWDGEAEARWVGEEIETLQRKKWDLNQIAVLVRAGFQMREFEDRFFKLGVPYRVIGGPRFYERLEIRDALAYLRVTVQPADDLALERIINTPKRAIGNATLQTLYSFARSKGISLYDAILTLCESDELRPKVKSTLMKLTDDFERWRGMMDTNPHTELASMILEESGYIQMWQMDKTPEAPGRLENLRELISGLSEFETLPEFLEHVALVLETQDTKETDLVTIMTLHGAKGLEFDAVFLPGWEEGLFPSQRTMDENGLKGLEEERRLAYVGITRARKKSYISFAGNRRIYGQWVNAVPARFVDELPEDDITAETDAGLYGPGRSSHWDSSGMAAAARTQERSRERKVMSEDGTIMAVQDRVFHDKFGYGTIIHIDGHKLDIVFDHGGKKRVLDSFVKKFN